MPDFLNNTLSELGQGDPFSTLWRLGMALLLGLLVAQVYRKSRVHGDISSSFPTTLILLCILISMVTQVIGDNVARAFSLVGALSIVRFRTVVRDTEDTAYVIFAVVTGMAVGANHLSTAVLGILVVAITSAWIRFRESESSGSGYFLVLRLALGMKPEDLTEEGFRGLRKKSLVSLATSRQGAAMEYIYEVWLLSTISVDVLVRQLNKQEGVQSVQIRRRDYEQQ